MSARIVWYFIWYYILFKSNRRHMPNHRAHKDRECYSFCCWILVSVFFLFVRLIVTAAAAIVGVAVTFVICWIQCVIVTFGFRLCHRKRNTKPNWLNCVLRMRNAKTNSFSVFSRHHLTFGVSECVCVCFICRLDCQRFCLFLHFRMCAIVLCRVSVMNVYLSFALFLSVCACARVEVLPSLGSLCFSLYLSLFCLLVKTDVFK